MKLWVIATVSFVMATAAARAGVAADVPSVPIKDADGKTYAVVVTCGDCQSSDATGECHPGVEDGWFDGQPCGKCLVTQNAGARFAYPFDLHITGKLQDPAGQPAKDRFVKLFMANGWNVRTKTFDDGTFRLILGATAERKGHSPSVTDIGVRIDTKKGADAHYAMFFMPEGYKPCPPTAAGSGTEKQADKAAKPSKKPGKPSTKQK